MQIRVPVPNPNLEPLPASEIPDDPERDERPAPLPEGERPEIPAVMNPIE